MNLKYRTGRDYSLLDAIAEQLLETGYSISFKTIQEMEIISACAHNSLEGSFLFLPFDPLSINAADLLDILFLLEWQPGSINQIVVREEGERDILINVLKKQEIYRADVLCLSQLKFFPLQLI